ncbi:hypothetical protein BN903_60 [Halorubrum sp. AJ67]|nr:hypothetical protein BN903_60 [Halorubrum sp. AJ67]
MSVYVGTNCRRLILAVSVAYVMFAEYSLYHPTNAPNLD